MNTEAHLFEKLKKRMPDLERSKYKFSSWDCYSRERNALIELKCRAKHYNPLLIEAKKYMALMSAHYEDDVKPIYINETPEGMFYWNVKETSPVGWEWRKLPKETEFTEETTWVWKFVGYLPTKGHELK